MRNTVEMSNFNLEVPLKDQDETEVLMVVASVCCISCHAVALQNLTHAPLTRSNNTFHSSTSIKVLGW